MKSKKNQQDKVIITQLVGCWTLLISKKNYRLIAADLSKQKASDADSRATQQIIFTGKVDAAAVIYYIYEKSKETVLEFYEGTTKVL